MTNGSASLSIRPIRLRRNRRSNACCRSGLIRMAANPGWACA
jgi:hypothetical protein